MKGKLQELLNLPYAVTIVPDQNTEGLPCYMASHPELPGCMSHGKTPGEALTNLAEAKELYIKTLLEKNEDVPVPLSSPTVVWDVTEAEAEAPEETPQIIPENISPLQSLEEQGSLG